MKKKRKKLKIKKEYINKTIEYLEEIHENVNLKDSLTEEIALIKKHIDAYGDREYGHITGCEYKTIADLIVTEETKLCMKEAQLDGILGEERYLSIYLSKLNADHREVIELRYLQKSEKVNTYDYIAKKMKLSESTATRKHTAAIKLITYFKYGEECKINETDEKMTENRLKNDGTMHDKVC